MWVVLAAVLLAVPAYAATSCPGSATAPAADLLALPGQNPFAFDWLPPGVRCATAEDEPLPAICRSRATITRDMPIEGSRRLIVADVVVDDGPRWDYVFVFGCVDHRVRAVFLDRSAPGVEVEEATRTRLVLRGADGPGSPEPRRKAFAWNDELQSYAWRRTRPPVDAPRCDDVTTMELEALPLVNPDGFHADHGMGCYSEIPEIDPGNCGWMLTLEADRPIGSNRRLVVVGRDHRGGVGWDGDVFVFGCLSGRVATLFAETYDRGATVEAASAEAITVIAGGWGPGDGACCPSRDVRRRYEWDARLASYVLRVVESRSRARRP